MNTRDRCLEIERIGIEMLKPFLDRDSDGHWLLIKGHPQTEKLQKECGDIFLTLPSGRMPSIEVKAEETYTGNLVFEVWSDACFMRDPLLHLREGSKIGWGLTCRAEVLACPFLDRRIAVFFRTIDMLRFAFDSRTCKLMSPPIAQRKHVQRNLTLFQLIPIKRFAQFFPIHCYRVDQGELFPENLFAIHQLVDDSKVAWHR